MIFAPFFYLSMQRPPCSLRTVSDGQRLQETACLSLGSERTDIQKTPCCPPTSHCVTADLVCFTCMLMHSEQEYSFPCLSFHHHFIHSIPIQHGLNISLTETFMVKIISSLFSPASVLSRVRSTQVMLTHCMDSHFHSRKRKSDEWYQPVDTVRNCEGSNVSQTWVEIIHSLISLMKNMKN